MLGDRRPGNVEMRRDLAGGQLLVPHEPEDPEPVRGGDRLQRCFHRAYVSTVLRKTQLKEADSSTRYEWRVDEELRAPLLALHKAVLAAERQNVERVHGAMSAAEFLQVVSDPLRYGWLKPLTELVLAAEADEDDEDAQTPEELRDRARDLLLPPKRDSPFGRRYMSLMQRDPALVMAHSAIAKLLA